MKIRKIKGKRGKEIKEKEGGKEEIGQRKLFLISLKNSFKRMNFILVNHINPPFPFFTSSLPRELNKIS